MLFPNPNKEKIEEQVTEQKVLLQEVLNDKPKKIEKIQEFPYIDYVEKEDLEGKHIFIDSGKRSLFTMMNDDGKFILILINKE